MRAMIVRNHGGPEALLPEDIATPIAGPGEVQIKVKACGVNHLDIWVRRGVTGHTFPLPLIPGNDMAGIVSEVGAGVDDLQTGDEVIVAPGTGCRHCTACLSGRDHMCSKYGIFGEDRNGGYAEYAVVPRRNVFKKPSNLSFEEAAAIGIPFLTAWHMLVDRAQLQPGEKVLIHSAGSGVGSAGVQIAKLWGAEVIATASTDEKAVRAQNLGADHIINYNKEDTIKTVKKLTSSKGVQVVFDHVGTDTWQTSLRSLAWHGRLVICGATTGGDAKLNLHHLFFKAQSILGSTMGSLGEFAEVLAHMERGTLKPVVDKVMPLCDAADAHRQLEARTIFGKVVLIP
ncbi:zinc-binding dehydrogenase [Myxococcota bacterium]|nr:zinc-binding dehydrogenase [Myxococcota bacterium]